MTYQCSSCSKSLPLEDYYVDSRTGGRKWSRCKECYKSELKDKYRSDEDTRVRKIKAASEYYEQNKEDVLARRKSSESVKLYQQQYRSTDEFRRINRIRAHNNRQINGVRESIPLDTIDRLIKEFGWKCLYPDCTTGDPIEIDHIIPLSLGGSNLYDNLQPLCRFHNRSKKNFNSTDYRRSSS